MALTEGLSRRETTQRTRKAKAPLKEQLRERRGDVWLGNPTEVLAERIEASRTASAWRALFDAPTIRGFKGRYQEERAAGKSYVATEREASRDDRRELQMLKEMKSTLKIKPGETGCEASCQLGGDILQINATDPTPLLDFRLTPGGGTIATTTLRLNGEVVTPTYQGEGRLPKKVEVGLVESIEQARTPGKWTTTEMVDAFYMLRKVAVAGCPEPGEDAEVITLTPSPALIKGSGRS